VLLLHGWTAGSDLTWFACFEELGRHFRVVAMDHRGHGRGMRTAARFTLEDCADDAAALIDVLDLKAAGSGPLLAVGYSLGGCVAQLLCRRHRGLVDGLVLCSTSAVFAESPVERRYFAALGALALASRITPGPLRRRLAHRVVGRRVADCSLQEWIVEELHRNDTTAVLEAGRALGGFDSRPWVGEVEVPTAVVVTTRDRQVLPARQHALAGAIAGSTVHEVAAGHDACVSAPRRFLPPSIAACESVAARIAAGAALGSR
jgi:3-oxoadipate enol-lactonase